MSKNKLLKKTEKYLKNKNFIFISIVFLLLITLATICELNNILYLILFVYWLYDVIFLLFKFKNRVFLLLFNMTFFTFTLSRPLINIIKDNNWYFSSIILVKVAYILFSSLFFMTVGSIIIDNMNMKEVSIHDSKYSKKLFNCLFLMLLITFIFNMYVQISIFYKMKNLDYALIYTNNLPSFNIFIRTMSAMFPYVVCAYLALMPRKINSLICLFLYVFASIPLFLLGSRSDLVLRLLFVIVYFIIRHIVSSKEQWITKKKVVVMLSILPLMIAFLGAYNYIREDEKVKSISLINLSLDFFHKQGTTFDTICQGILYEKELKNNFNVASYTFGTLIDYFTHNTIAIKLFNAHDLGIGNNINMIKYGNNMAHNISYVVLGEESYLAGHGRGTSYLLETYVDCGYFGVIIYSVLMGMYLSSILYLIRKNNFVISFIVLMSLSQIFLVPRYASFGFISYLLTPHFYFILFAVLFMKKIFGECSGDSSE